METWNPVPLPSVLAVLKPAVGPSSSHTLGPLLAGLRFRQRLEERGMPEPGDRISVTLYGSLAHTGRGHLADLAVVAGLSGRRPAELAAHPMQAAYDEASSTGVLLLSSGAVVFQPATDVLFDTDTPQPHPNTLRFALHDGTGRVVLSTIYCSVGAGAVVEGSELGTLEHGRRTSAVLAREIVDDCVRRGESLVNYYAAFFI